MHGGCNLDRMIRPRWKMTDTGPEVVICLFDKGRLELVSRIVGK